MALLAPMPMASMSAAMAVNAGSRRSTRAAYRKSCQRVIMDVGRWRVAVVSFAISAAPAELSETDLETLLPILAHDYLS